MDDKNTFDRKQLILRHLKRGEYTKVSDLASRCGVSTVTIRNHLTALETEGLVVRQHGKVALSDKSTISFSMRSQMNNAKKLSIARCAADIAIRASSITLDAGTTTLALANELTKNIMGSNSTLSVVTNSIPISSCLCGTSQIEVSVVGGILMSHSLCTVGPDAEAYLQSLRTQYAFMGCTGIRGTEGLCTGIRLESSIKHALLKTGAEVIVLMDDSKFESEGMSMFAEFSEIHTIITTRGICRPDVLEHLDKLGVRVIYADDIYPL